MVERSNRGEAVRRATMQEQYDGLGTRIIVGDA